MEKIKNILLLIYTVLAISISFAFLILLLACIAVYCGDFFAGIFVILLWLFGSYIGAAVYHFTVECPISLFKRLRG